jgi:methyl halide transferase
MDASKPEYWNQVYVNEARPGWDMDGPTPLVAELLSLHSLATESKIAVPGCGLGHDAAELARCGFQVTGFDFAPLAIEGARARYGSVVDWRQEDWFSTDQKAFDGVFDHTCFVAMEPVRRSEYIARTKFQLRASGIWMGAFFHEVRDPQGPPFAIHMDELRTLVEVHFEILHLALATQSHPRRAGREFLMIARAN